MKDLHLFALLIFLIQGCAHRTDAPKKAKSQEKKATSSKQAPTPSQAKQEQAKNVADTLNVETPDIASSKANKALLKKRPTFWKKDKIGKFCNEVDGKFKNYGWGRSYCDKLNWHHVRDSYLGRPLLWMAYGDENKHEKEPMDSTLILCGVHGDEITPIKFCFDIIYHLENNKDFYKNRMIVVAPMVTPDSFFKRRPTRTNYRGVDVNRNFPTADWNADAIRLWKNRYRSDKRRYPGKSPKTEAEVVFQMNLIKRYNPSKIISVHAPLTLLDYDGPGDDLATKAHAQGFLAKRLLIQMSEKASDYRIKNYPYFPGSLGNWAGKERDIPTYTWELPTSDARNHKRYWKLFKQSIHLAIMRDLDPRRLTAKTITPSN